MGRRRQSHLELPQRMQFKQGRYYYGREGLALGADKREALLRYAELETGDASPGTFADAAKAYREQELAGKAPKTQREYSRQLNTLCLVFGLMPMSSIRPVHVVQYMRERKPVAAVREKALMSAVWNWAREYAYTDAANPCTGIRRARAKRDRYVTDAELADALGRADPVLAGFLELCYLTGQRPGDVLKMRRQDIQDGALHVQQAKRKTKLRIEIVGPLAALLERLMSGGVDGHASGALRNSVIDARGVVGGTESKAARGAPSGHARWTGVGNPGPDSNRSRAGVESGPLTHMRGENDGIGTLAPTARSTHPEMGDGRERSNSRDSPERRAPIASVWLIHDASGQRPTLGALRKRHRLLGCGWQIRDLRAKAASDMETAKGAQNLLGHSASSTTDIYIRQRVGQRVMPIMKETKK